MAKLMPIKPDYNAPKIIQQTGHPTGRQFEQTDQLVVLLPPRAGDALWRRLPQGKKLKGLVNRRGRTSVPAVSSRLGNRRQSGIHVAIADKNADAFARLTLARKLVAATMSEKPRSIGIWVCGFDADDQAGWTNDLAAAVLAAAFSMPTFKSKPARGSLRTVRILGLDEKIDTSRVSAETAGTNLVRWLTAMPANKLDANAYVALAREIARDSGWTFKKYGVAELRKLGAGAFLGVAQGNDNDSAAIVRLQYRPGEKNAPPDLSLVGKGIIFDTGGTNLKPFNSMLDMHTDMSGSAVALATCKTISDLQLPMNVDCWLAITENRTGPLAYKSQDILVAANGKTIQTIHTDAEGRLALADTLVFASQEKPRAIIDFATLTGACVVGISERYSGVFSNRAKLHPTLKRAGAASGERVWPFPIGDEFIDGLKSDTADIMQCAVSGGGDHIYAASFLGEFVDKKIPWVHVDLSACSHKGGLAHVPTEITGFGVRFTMNLLLDQQLLDQQV